MELRKIRMGIVGAGTWGETHASIYAEHLFADPAAICDMNLDIACAMAEAKKDILIEKPLATTKEDIARICEAVEKNGVRCMVDLHNRWNPPFNTAKQEIASGKLGKPYTAYIRHSDVKWVATDMLSWAAKSTGILCEERRNSQRAGSGYAGYLSDNDRV